MTLLQLEVLFQPRETLQNQRTLAFDSTDWSPLCREIHFNFISIFVTAIVT
jgi:hypothetical protein